MSTVSFIIACYNSAWSLPALAENLGRIGAEQHEVILVDDGSRDGSADRFAQLAPWARVIRQDHRGQGAARNAAVAAAQGEFIQWLDADDTLLPEKLPAQLAFAQAQAAEVVWSDWRRVWAGRGPVTYDPIQSARPPSDDMIDALLQGWWAPPAAYLLRRAAYLEVGGCDESLHALEDPDLFLRLAIAGKRHAYLPGYLANYHRFRDRQTLAGRDLRQNIFDRERIWDKAAQALAASGRLGPARRRLLAQAFHRLARHAYHDAPDQYDRLIARCYQYDPAFQPNDSTWVYRLSARLVGVRRAERLSAWKRARLGPQR